MNGIVIAIVSTISPTAIPDGIPTGIVIISAMIYTCSRLPTP